MNIPLVHITDLYHPPQDPDDHMDLATVYALPELDLKALILDSTRRFLDPAPKGYDIARDPGFVPCIQMNYISGRTVPIASGPLDPLRNETDTVEDRPAREQAGIELLLDVLRRSEEKLVITVVGSVRVLAAAFNREPALVREKTRAVVLNAGSVASHLEWNVKLDTPAFVRLWRSGLPIHWYPCASDTGGFDLEYPHNTYWYAKHSELLSDLPPLLKAWFSYAYTGNSRGDIISFLHQHSNSAVWDHVLSAKRNMWSTASIIMTAGRELAETECGWQFLPRPECTNYHTLKLKLLPIKAEVNEQGLLNWKETDRHDKYFIFRREGGERYRSAMTQALRSLLGSLQFK